MDSAMNCPDLAQNAGSKPNKKVPKAEDLCAILNVVLESHMESQETGFVWDLQCDGKTFKNVEFVMFTPFFKVDSNEAEKLCGKCTSRTGNVGCLCRHCECPTEFSDCPFAECPCKTTKSIRKLRQKRTKSG